MHIHREIEYYVITELVNEKENKKNINNTKEICTYVSIKILCSPLLLCVVRACTLEYIHTYVRVHTLEYI